MSCDQSAANNPSADSELQVSKAVYDYALVAVGRATEYYNRTESKIATINGLVGVMLTIVLTATPHVFPSGGLGQGLVFVGQVFLIGAIAALVSALGFGLLALLSPCTLECGIGEAVRIHTDMPEGNPSSVDFFQQMTRRFEQVENSFHAAGMQKQRLVRGVYASLFIFIGSLTSGGLAFLGYIIETTAR